MIWAIYALFYSLFRAAFAETNRIFRVDSMQLLYLQSLVALVLMLPLAFFMNWPEDPRFYIAAGLVSLVVTSGMLQHLNLAEQKMGRVSGVYLPFEAFAAGVLWVAIGPPELLQAYTAHPLVLGAMVLAFVLCTASILTIRDVDISWQSFAMVAPVGCTLAIAAVVTKMVLPHQMVMPQVLTFVFINYVMMTIFVGLYLLAKGRITGALFRPQMVKAGGYAGVFALLGYLSYVTALAYAPNPGFVSMMAMMVPVWLMAYHKTAAVKDSSSVISGLMLGFGILILLYISAMHLPHLS